MESWYEGSKSQAYSHAAGDYRTLEEILSAGGTVDRAIEGVFHTDVLAPVVEYNKADNEIIYPDQKSPTQIVFGADRPAHRSSGFGAKGAQQAGRIDLVVGRMAGMRNETLPDVGPRRAEPGNQVDPSFAADAARIYISQMTKVDDYFGLADGIMGPNASIGKSAVAIKADGVRVIGREGVKIVTGGAQGVSNFGDNGEPNSLGGKISRGPTIELIAGNKTGKYDVGIPGFKEEIDHLQPVPLGTNLNDALTELVGLVNETCSATSNLILAQRRINYLVMSGLTAAALPPPAAVLPVAGIVGAIGTQQLLLGARVKSSLWQTRINSVIWRLNYLYPFGYKYISSRDVFTT